MLFRFCLYGFLKNQQYYDPFLILAFREKGLSFAAIGLLIGFRELWITILEVPTGAVADVLGRRRAMVFSFMSYIVAFLIFGLSRTLWMLFAAMWFFSIGEAFRTGTHKAMIFDWLSRQGRAGEKVAVYGVTRSWSKLGSAASVLIAAAMVFITKEFSSIFLFSVLPYAANIVNFLTYPTYLDGPRRKARSVGVMLRTIAKALGNTIRRRPLRRLVAESMAFEGAYKVGKDYLQPVVKTAALALPVMAFLADCQRTAVLVGAVYFVLYLVSTFASRHAGWLVRRARSEARGARWLWWLFLGGFGSLLGGILAGSSVMMIGAFVALATTQNFWRPVLIGRVADLIDSDELATGLSIESQAKTLFAAMVAPVLGLAVDMVAGVSEGFRFLPVAAFGMAVAACMLLTGARDERDRTQGHTA